MFNKVRFSFALFSIKCSCFILILFLFAVSNASGQQATGAGIFKQLHDTSHDSVRVRLYAELADFYYKKSYPDSSIFFVQKGINLSQRIKLSAHLAELYRLLGSNYRKKNNYSPAIKFLTKSKAIAINLHQNAQIEKAGLFLSLTYASKGDYKNCIKEITQNLDFAERTGSNLRLYENYLLLSDLNMRFGNDSLGHYYLRKSWQAEIDTTKKPVKPYRRELKLIMLSDSIVTFLKSGKYQSADKLLMTLARVEHSLSNDMKDLYVNMIEDVVRAYLDYNFNQDALVLLKYMLHYIDKEKIDKAEYIQLTIYPLITKIYLKQGKLSQAIFWNNKSRMLINSSTLLTDVTSISSKIDILRNESTILEKRGLYKQALPHLHTLETLQQTLNQKRKDIELMQVTAVSELETNKQKVESLNDHIKIQNLTMENDERRRMFLLMLVFLLILLCAMIFIFLRHANREQKLLFEQKVKIEAQSKELEDANQIKDKLFSIIGHDLRSPVADLLTTLDVANDLKPDKMKQYMFRMKDKIRYLYDVIDNLLNWSVIHLNTRQAPLKLINFKDAIRETMGLLESTAHKKNITIINQVEDNSGYANEHKLQVIFRNILSNAIKFTPEEGFIRIFSINQAALTGIAIKDSGMGLDSNILHNIYANLESKPGTSGEKGTGLGLRLSKELIEKQGGAMKIISHAGNGTVVKLYFKKQLEESLLA